MPGSLRYPFAGAVLMMLMQTVASPADAQATTNDASARGGYASEVPKDRLILNNDGAALAADDDERSIPVALELEFILQNVQNDFRKRGAFDENLKAVVSVDYYGVRYVGSERYPLEIHDARPDWSRTLLKIGESAKFEIGKSDKGITVHGDPKGLSVENERALLETFEFDTPVVALEKNPQAFKPLGMVKLPGMLTWKIQVNRPGGYHRVLYVDSHTGDVVKFTVLDRQGARVLDVAQHDYRSVEGIRVPFVVDYRSSDGTLLSSDRIERVEVKRKPS
jgi:hypothetical protein